jgi:tRNA A37 threonylcarbamoyltransferase TsaD
MQANPRHDSCETARHTTAGSPITVHFHAFGLSTDNAAMIAAAAFPKLARAEYSSLPFLEISKRARQLRKAAARRRRA